MDLVTSLIFIDIDTMQEVNIPKTNLHASTLAFGTDYFGSTVSRELSMQLMDRYFEAGGNVLDTAELYAGWIPGGEHQSEKTVGARLRDRRVRDQIIFIVQWHIKHGFAALPYLTQANGYFRRLEQNTLDIPAGARVRVLFDHHENRKRFERLRHLQEKYEGIYGQEWRSFN